MGMVDEAAPENCGASRGMIIELFFRNFCQQYPRPSCQSRRSSRDFAAYELLGEPDLRSLSIVSGSTISLPEIDTTSRLSQQRRRPISYQTLAARAASSSAFIAMR